MSTVDSHAGPLDFADDAADQLHHAAHQYLLELGWTTTLHDNQLALELDEDIWGLRMPADLASGLVAALHRKRLSCPVIDVPGGGSIMLLEPTDGAEQARSFPRPVDTLPAGHRVPLPPSVTPHGPVRWLTALQPHGTARPPVHTVADTLARLIEQR